MSRSGLLFLDSDLFVLYAAAGLLRDLITCAGFHLTDARRLQPLAQMLRKGRISKKYPPGVTERAKAWCSQIPAIDRAPSPHVLERLVRIPEVDPGEAFLFSLAAEANDAIVATGDKRACRALNRATGLDDVRAQLEGKILTFEAGLWILMEHIGYPDLIGRLMAIREYNQTLRVLLPQGNLTPEEDFKSGLDSYLGALSRDAGELLFTKT